VQKIPQYALAAVPVPVSTLDDAHWGQVDDPILFLDQLNDETRECKYEVIVETGRH
jgi:hypothetical protein